MRLKVSEYFLPTKDNNLEIPTLQNGFIYPVFHCLLLTIRFLNLIEWFKFIAENCVSDTNTEVLGKKSTLARGLAIDAYMVLKWTTIYCFISVGADGWISLYVTYYMIASNVYSYFYYHVWDRNRPLSSDVERQRRRLMSFLLSLFFYIICYAYLHQFHYFDCISWPEDGVTWLNALYLSFANAFTLTYGGFSPLDINARILFISELINTFFFFTIIVAVSIPSK